MRCPNASDVVARCKTAQEVFAWYWAIGLPGRFAVTVPNDGPIELKLIVEMLDGLFVVVADVPELVAVIGSIAGERVLTLAQLVRALEASAVVLQRTVERDALRLGANASEDEQIVRTRK